MQNDLIIKDPLIVVQNSLRLYVFKLTSEEIHNHFVISRRLENERRRLSKNSQKRKR